MDGKKIALIVAGVAVVAVGGYVVYVAMHPPTKGLWEACKSSDDCKDENCLCRKGDMRCLADADCAYANTVDKEKGTITEDRDCTAMPRSWLSKMIHF